MQWWWCYFVCRVNRRITGLPSRHYAVPIDPWPLHRQGRPIPPDPPLALPTLLHIISTVCTNKYSGVVLLFLLLQLVEDCEELLAPVQEVDASFQGLWNVLWDAGELSSCENLNGLYQEAVYDELCDDLPRGLLGFWVSCFFLTLLLVVLVRSLNPTQFHCAACLIGDVVAVATACGLEGYNDLHHADPSTPCRRPRAVVVGLRVASLRSTRQPQEYVLVHNHRRLRQTLPPHIFVPSVPLISLLVASFPPLLGSHLYVPGHSFSIRRSFSGTGCSGSRQPRRTLRCRGPCSPGASPASAVSSPRGGRRGPQALPAGRILRRGRGRRSRQRGVSVSATGAEAEAATTRTLPLSPRSSR